ncbi:MAG: sugar transferase [Actinomycetia bacterium]|nr:sugar transferase [Actinomycetes bacterium]
MYVRIGKRLLDLLLALIASPFVLLALAILAPLIRHEDKGPVFYRAARMGKDGKPFTMYKLRSMHVDAPDLRTADGSTYNAADDARQTNIGRLLRRTSLDELPQLFNIWKGDMSFIGPRPDDLQEAALYQGDEACKLQLRPGISGYAQVFGRNAIQWRDRLALDIYYVQHISFLLDLRIFWRTFAVVFSQEGVFVKTSANAGSKNGADGTNGDAGSGCDLSDNAGSGNGGG